MIVLNAATIVHGPARAEEDFVRHADGQRHWRKRQEQRAAGVGGGHGELLRSPSSRLVLRLTRQQLREHDERVRPLAEECSNLCYRMRRADARPARSHCTQCMIDPTLVTPATAPSFRLLRGTIRAMSAFGAAVRVRARPCHCDEHLRTRTCMRRTGLGLMLGTTSACISRSIQ